jgi:hypothetical protein
MRIDKGVVAMVIAVAFVAASGSPMAAQDNKNDAKKADAKKDAKKDEKKDEASAEWKTYVTYVNALARATKLEDLFQYMSNAQLEIFKGIKPADRLKVLQDLKDAMTARGAFSGTMRLLREESEPTAMYLVLESTAPTSQKIQGRVKMVREIGQVKLASMPEDEGWHPVK